ncbi:hypothetical protein GOBAR_AA03916 [Gossypium barbadense]|uniref:glutamate synthase (ferredoxin) n=1 Tax=Gossypium barbadense TaxID=3634 RepID=A0A2P5YM32_GOSBA|nr:hypothetical protein GOBAR_AA03916 [Gossypium barbadense]
MANLHSLSPVLHPTYRFSSDNGLLLVDFVGLYCKSKPTTRRRLPLSLNTQTMRRFSTSAANNSMILYRVMKLSGTGYPMIASVSLLAFDVRLMACLQLGDRIRSARFAEHGALLELGCSEVTHLFEYIGSMLSSVTLCIIKVANLEDIISERGACGVGFIANLENKASHGIVQDALTALGCMEHRGGCGADNDSGDIVNTFRQEGLEVLGWRSVPVNTSVVGFYAKETMPNIQQIFVRVVKEENVDDIERELYICRKLIERAAASETWGSELYFCSLSNQTIVYKGMLRSEVLGLFYSDLQNDLYKSPLAIYHRRYSTNTSPRWPLAQPMRFLGHNGEINTVQGNLNWMQSRETSLKSPVWRGRENEIRPFGNPKASDSANLDSAAELLIRSGRNPDETLMILVPEAYKNHPTLLAKYPEVVDFYDYYKGQMEAWDGPALLLFSDGKTVGACLDRNGLRPARYWRTIDNVVYVASEVGVLPVDDSKVIMKGRLGPGMMITADLLSGQLLLGPWADKVVIVVDFYDYYKGQMEAWDGPALLLFERILRRQQVYENTEVKKRVAAINAYGKWVSENMRPLKPVNFLSTTLLDSETILRRQQWSVVIYLMIWNTASTILHAKMSYILVS